MDDRIKETIEYDVFSKVDIRVGTITTAENIAKSEKLLKLEVDFGVFGKRQILAGIAKWYKPEDLLGIKTTFVMNLPPREMMGLKSEGMLFALGLKSDAMPVLLIPNSNVENGDGAR